MPVALQDVVAVTPPLKATTRGNSRYVLVPSDWPRDGDLRLVLLPNTGPRPQEPVQR